MLAADTSISQDGPKSHSLDPGPVYLKLMGKQPLGSAKAEKEHNSQIQLPLQIPLTFGG